MEIVTSEAELAAIKQEFVYQTEQMLQIVQSFNVNNVAQPYAVNKLRKAQLAYIDLYVKLIHFIDIEVNKRTL